MIRYGCIRMEVAIRRIASSYGFHSMFRLHRVPVVQAYDGMIVGEHSRDTDHDVNPVRSKELSNMRAAGKDENVKLSSPRLMILEEAIGYVASDELIEMC
ncbi:hypothetical protein F3Y22_tig00117016pilonHSYRG00662 [Hibiscus syriacus]|uniref:TypA/BipA C-terminal domain-containing protein n=1 Tax=Hibiscus syriacus TaxID=106335 RepID=A0A6A2WIV7_HIBSY|nr:hypothetical protein F3Y22_tig00117016pilonHSYRG00662 [Hibiscus syriacus]